MKVKKGKEGKTLRNKGSLGGYLALLSTKYGVDPDKLFQALILAGENQESRCENLSIECRGKLKNSVIFLIMEDSRVVAQFPIPTDFLLSQNNPIKDFMKIDRVQKYTAKRENNSRHLLIKDLRAGMRQVNLMAKVLEIPTPRVVVTKFGNYASVAHALIADETGAIKLCLWNDQINSVASGDIIKIENARISTFRGEMQLSLGKAGTLRNIGGLYSQLKEANCLLEK